MVARNAYPVCARYYLRKWEASSIESIGWVTSEKQLTREEREMLQQMARMCADIWNTCADEGGRL